jgi:CubicO group peptidase (beta-lactamase class C family)
MRRMKRLLLLLVLATSLSAQTLEKKVDAYVAPLAKANVFSGVVFIAKGDEVVFEKAYGMASYEFSIANTPRTRFAVASITKLFTRALLTKLYEQGKLSPDDKLAKWVPDFPGANEITLAHLASHRSGLRDPDHLRRIIRLGLTTAQTVEKLKSRPLGSEPGKEYSYTTANYAVLAHVIERVTGKPFADVVAEFIYHPAGMKDSGELTTASVIPRLASGYMPDPLTGGIAVCGMEDPSWKAGGGSSYSTARDLHRFIRAYYAGRFFATRDFNAVFPERQVFDRRALSANGAFPGASANLLHFPDDGVTVVVLSNNYATVPSMIAGDVAGMMFDVAYKNPVVPKAIDKPVETRIAGAWRIEGRPWTPNIEVQQGKLVLAWNDVRRSALIRISEDTWFSPLDWSRLRFTPDGRGEWLYQDDAPIPMSRVE